MQKIDLDQLIIILGGSWYLTYYAGSHASGRGCDPSGSFYNRSARNVCKHMKVDYAKG